MRQVIDFHAHLFPDSLLKARDTVKSSLSRWVPGEYFDRFHQSARPWLQTWLKPVSALHELQPSLRHLPDSARRAVDPLSLLAVVPRLMVESTPEDFTSEMDRAGVQRALVIAHPPYASNEWVIELSRETPRFIAAVNIPHGTPSPAERLRRYVDDGAAALKIHAAADGADAHSATYRDLIRTADQNGLPVILHTGCLHLPGIYKDSRAGNVENFEEWFSEYSSVKFVLAHMNFHEPERAMDLAERHSNVWVDTSWQPSEVIGEAARRLGAERILFGSDWPFLGGNVGVGLRRLDDCVSSGLITNEQADLIRGQNAAQLLKLETIGSDSSDTAGAETGVGAGAG